MKFVLFITLILLAGLMVHSYNVYQDSGGGYIAIDKKPGACETITEMIGPEDMALGGNTLYVSSNDNRMLGKNKVYNNGSIYAINLETGQRTLLEHDYKDEFHPHGIAYYRFENNKFLYVINHKQEEDSIVVFKLNENNMQLHKEIIDNKLVNGNDIAIVDSNRFYVTRDHRLTTHLGRFIENFSRIGLGELLFYDNGEFSIVKDRIKFANGLAIDRERKKLYMAEMLGKKIFEFNISQVHRPKVERVYPLTGAPDNIYLKGDDLYIATHNKVLDLKLHQDAETNLAPSSIYRMNINDGKPLLLYSNFGGEISAASVGVPINNKIYIGTIFDKKLLVCDYAFN